MLLLRTSFMLILFIAVLQLPAQVNAPQIALNQVGYYAAATKLAVVINAPNATQFYVLSENKKDTVYRGTLGAPVPSVYSAAITRAAVFTGLTTKGNYVLYLPGVGFSYPFSIDENIYQELGKASVKAFYFQRASMPLQSSYAGIWARAEGHPDTTVFIHPSAVSISRSNNTVIATPGGWYDAGDYNKYMVNSGITMGTLLSAYEDFPKYFTTQKINIPESNNGIPDLLNETLYNLRWMLTMQDKDGGVYQKCTNANFDAMVMPDAAVAKRWVVQKGTAATLDFAAVMAQASRICKQFPQQLPGLADSCLVASKLAWSWAEKNPAVVYNQDQMNTQFLPKIVTGGYGDKNFSDEFFWAACELLATTKDPVYLPAIANPNLMRMGLPSWSEVGLLGAYTLLRLQKQLPPATLATISTMGKKITGIADALVSNGGNKAFGTIFGQNKNEFNWGSNAGAMNQSILLINAYQINKNKKYLSAALTNIDYILGRNATGYCFVTGFGAKPAMHPHHRPSVADQIAAPVPGFLVGGPNPGRQDKCFYAQTAIETSYTDDDCAYACNEIAINWNAPLVYVANALEALQKKF